MLRADCERVLRANDRGAYTVPSPRLYPHQWAWDSALAAIGWAHVDPHRAWTELETLMAAQWSDGRVPHIVFHELSSDYAPGPELWGAGKTSTVSQPPVWATAARRIVEVAGGREQAVRLLPRFDASHRFFQKQRDPLGYDLVAVAHPWESGLDNSPAWDEPLGRVDRSSPPPFRRRDTHVTGDPSVRPTDNQYLAYACLVKAIQDDGFGPGPFAVYDPALSAILARAEDDLAWLAEHNERPDIATGARQRAATVRRALLKRLWDEELGRFVYFDAPTKTPICCDVIGGYLPLWCGLPARHAEQLVSGLTERYRARWPLPSTAPGEAAYEPRRYWRGPSWVNVNWFISTALRSTGSPSETAQSFGAELARTTIELVRQHGCWEYFHPDTGEGLGAPDFAWTAALTLDLLARTP